MVLFDDYIYIFYNTSPEYPTKVKLEKEELQSLRELSHPKAEKDAKNQESTPFEPLKFKLGACGGTSAPEFELFIEKERFGLRILL